MLLALPTVQEKNDVMRHFFLAIEMSKLYKHTEYQ